MCNDTQDAMTTVEEQASALIDALGGTGQVATMCAVRAPSISQWRKRGIPRPWMLYFQAKFPEKFGADGRVLVSSTQPPME